MSDVKHNSMTAPREADAECHKIFQAVKQDVLKEIQRLNREDSHHGLHEITEYTFILYATEDVAFGCNYFAKIHLGDGKYVHARAHKQNDDDIIYHSLLTTPECAVWDKDTPLEYIID
ncbi:hypothetical protein BG005_002155 [Podila minutissima]|nr:hypothetical protein BG005_002155 [Podila minutissima]